MSKGGRWVWDEAEKRLVPSNEYYAKQAAGKSQAAFFMTDIAPFISPIDGKEISSRSALREHERRHNVFQVGNDIKPADYDAAARRRQAPNNDRAIENAYRVAVQKAGL